MHSNYSSAIFNLCPDLVPHEFSEYVILFTNNINIATIFPALETDGHVFKQQYHTTESPVPSTENTQNISSKEHVETDYTDTHYSSDHQTETNTVVDITEPFTFRRLSTSVLPINPTSSYPKLIFPTKPSETGVVSGERIVSASHPDGGSMTDSMSMNGTIFSLVFPTTMRTSLGLIDISRTTFSYAIPTPLPPINKTSALISFLKSDMIFTKNKTVKSDHTKSNKTLQTNSKSKDQVHDSLTTPSRIINDQRYFASIITDKNTEENTEENEQSNSLRKLGQPFKPLITFQTSTVKTSTGNASSFPMHLSLANTGKENHFLDNSTTGGRNYYGFYMHSESG